MLVKEVPSSLVVLTIADGESKGRDMCDERRPPPVFDRSFSCFSNPNFCWFAKLRLKHKDTNLVKSLLSLLNIQ